MQIVDPIDVEDAARADLADMLAEARCFAPPAPDDLAAGDVMVTSLGGPPLTEVVHEYDLSVDVWGATEAEAAMLAAAAAGAIGALPLLGAHAAWKTARASAPYINPDPKRPTLPRYTFAATVAARGSRNKLI